MAEVRKKTGRGFQTRDKGTADQFTLIFLDPGSARGCGRTREDYEQSLFFLVPRGKSASHENGLAKSEGKERLLYTLRTQEA